MKLYQQQKPEVEVGENTYAFRDDFRTLLKVYAVLKDDEIIDADKLAFIEQSVFFGKTGKDTAEALKAYLALFSGKKGEKGERVMDLEQDAELIYAGFYQCYGIDLFTVELTAEQFSALLRGLPDGCRLSEIIRIRTMDMPEPNKYNQKQRAAVAKAKRSVALTSENDNPFKDFGQTIKALGDMSRAKNNGG